MKEKLKDALIKICGYVVAATWLVGIIVVPVLIILGAIKLIMMMFGG